MNLVEASVVYAGQLSTQPDHTLLLLVTRLQLCKVCSTLQELEHDADASEAHIASLNI